jgi:hypothetical protein
LALVAAQGLLVPPPAFGAEAPVAGTIDMRHRAGAARGVDELMLGQLSSARAGSAVAFVGDLDADGRQDYAVGSPYAHLRRGEVAVVYGPPQASTGLGSKLGSRGFRLVGPHSGAYAGLSVSGIGDVNGDGHADMLVGAPRARFSDRGASGAAYAVLGGPRRSGRSSLSSSEVVIAGAGAGDDTGHRVGSVGDLDGDGRGELVIGAPDAATAGRPDAGAVFVLYSSALGSGVDLASLAGRGFRIDGAAAGDDAGLSVAGVADMSGDGLPEVVLGAPSATAGAGTAYVVWGKPPAAAAPVDLAALGAQGLALSGQPGEHACATVAGLADATRDGIPDVAVGAPDAAPYGRGGAGTVYVVSGTAAPGASSLASAPLRIHGGDAREHLGRVVAPAGDVDGDGVADLLIGLSGEAALARRGAGSVVVLLTGRVRGSELDAALLGYSGVRLAGPGIGAGAGRAVAGAVDVDGDRRADVLAGLPGLRRNRGGAALVLLPAAPNLPATPTPAERQLATNIQAIVEDSRSMSRDDPGGLLRRQALELTLTNPANQGRVFGAVEFDSAAHQLLPPLPAGDPTLNGERLAVVRALLRERVLNTGARTGALAGFGAGAALNPGAQARILITGAAVGDLSAAPPGRTYVIGVNVTSRSGRDQLTAFARASGGEFYAVDDAAELQSALAAIDAALRGDTALAANVVDTPGVTEVPSARGEVAAAVTRPHAVLAVRSTLPAAKARTVSRLRLAVTWDRRDTRFTTRVLRLRLRGGRTLKVGRVKLRRALRGRTQRIGSGLTVRGHAGRTFLTLDVRGLTGRRPGRRAAAAVVFGARASVRIGRRTGSRRAVARCRWTYQSRPR